MQTNKPLYDTGYRVGHKVVFGHARKEPEIQAIPYTVTSVVDGKLYRGLLKGYGQWATRQNGLLDGKDYKPSTADSLCEAMNRIAHKNATGVHHWVTEGEIHWAYMSRNLETGVISVSDWGVL